MPPDYSGQNLRGRSFKGQDLVGPLSIAVWGFYLDVVKTTFPAHP